jgi:uncharacterized protein YndB with AHSA1/START domain
MSSTTDRAIVSSRVVNFPRELVFRAWTEPEHLQQWWGPKGFTNTFYEFDLQPGGFWRFTMHGPDGKNYENESCFTEIETPERIVFDHLSAPVFQVLATFDESGDSHDKTLITYLMLFETPEIRDKIASYAIPANEENFDRLEVELEKMQKTGI